MIELQAELFKKSQEVKKQQQDGAGYSRKTRINLKKTSLFDRKNKGVDRRSTKDYSKKGELSYEEKDALEISKRALEAKANLYEKMKKGLVSDRQDEHTGESRFLIDFDKKIYDEQYHPPDEEDGPSSLYDDEVDFKDLPPDKRELLSFDMRREMLREKWEQEEIANLDQPIHYSNVQFDEARAHGVGYFKFSQTEEERAKELEELHRLRKQTLDTRKRRKEQKKQRKKMMKQRLKKIERRKLVQQGKDVPDQEEPDEDSSDVSSADEEEIELLTREEKPVSFNETKKREWDKGKEAEMLAEQRPKFQSKAQPQTHPRDERHDEFAPPSSYFNDNKRGGQSNRSRGGKNRSRAGNNRSRGGNNRSRGGDIRSRGGNRGRGGQQRGGGGQQQQQRGGQRGWNRGGRGGGGQQARYFNTVPPPNSGPARGPRHQASNIGMVPPPTGPVMLSDCVNDSLSQLRAEQNTISDGGPQKKRNVAPHPPPSAPPEPKTSKVFIDPMQQLDASATLGAPMDLSAMGRDDLVPKTEGKPKNIPRMKFVETTFMDDSSPYDIPIPPSSPEPPPPGEEPDDYYYDEQEQPFDYFDPPQGPPRPIYPFLSQGPSQLPPLRTQAVPIPESISTFNPFEVNYPSQRPIYDLAGKVPLRSGNQSTFPTYEEYPPPAPEEPVQQETFEVTGNSEQPPPGVIGSDVPFVMDTRMFSG